ncbi:MAG: YihA family ribosome biogenesis GTP-binding protein [Saprospiraceae bacterium]|nr:ribosome biogenesis GTP-binding protein YihA/YsxC [Bacteroidia bacterium]NNF21695.1 YihA family ribosome biogenesis GTP-binding protein [Saprospiraceae bacterium]NNK90005.1 YihA family ribosome biogenesis GTP-binding protein [Saprospiraceae bacterium]
MLIKEVEFIGSFEHESQCPKTNLPEYAFIGRSNVGKSSLINALTGRKDIARISSTPGKTQTLNYFLVNNSWYLVDLPGYGYAKISKTKREKWRKMIDRYLSLRKSLYCVISLIDARHELQKKDLEFLDWLGENRVPFAIAYTKIDKVKKSQRENNISKIRNELLKYWEELPAQFATSAHDNIGIKEILDFIEEINNN